MMKLRNITQKFKKSFYKRSNLYSNSVVDLDSDGENLIINCKSDIYSRNYSIVLKHRLSDKRIEKKVGNGQIKFSFKDLSNIGLYGTFDLYFNCGLKLIRIKGNSKNDVILNFSKKNCILKSYTTKNGNSALILKPDFDDITIKSILSSGDNVIFKNDFEFVNDFYLIDFFIEIKNRLTGKRINNKITSNEVVFNLDEILNLDDSSNFDIYFKYKFSSKIIKKRIKYKMDFQLFNAVSLNKNRVLKAFQTRNHNLIFKSEEKFFDSNISDLSVENKKLRINGELQIFNNEIYKVDKIELIAKNRENNHENSFNLTFSQHNEKYIFEGIIGEILNEKVINLRFDFYLKLYCDDIYYISSINLNNFKIFNRKEDKFLAKIDFNDNIYSYYATERNHSLALWITTENSWNKSFEITKGKSIYDETMAKYDLDDKMIFFESFFGKSYSGNPKYIYEAMLEMGMDREYTFVWAYSGENKEIIPGNPIIVNRYEAGDYYRYLARAKYWVNNIIFPIHKKRKGNVYLQTWHGTPLKKLGYDITIPGPEVNARRNFYKESRNWDYLISSNQYSSEIFKRAFKFDKEVLELGYPVNDIFFTNNDDVIDQLKSKLNIDKNKKIILYAPTWKDDEQSGNWQHYFNLEINLKRLYDELGSEYIILLKMHHLVSENLEIDNGLKDFAIDVSKWDDIQQLYILSDILITDYSSVFFDYAHSRKPILFFVPDLEHYISNVRGLYLNMKQDLPGPLIKDNDKLIDVIKNINEVSDEYSEKYDEFYNKFCTLCNGESGKDIVRKVFKV